MDPEIFSEGINRIQWIPKFFQPSLILIASTQIFFNSNSSYSMNPKIFSTSPFPPNPYPDILPISQRLTIKHFPDAREKRERVVPLILPWKQGWFSFWLHSQYKCLLLSFVNLMHFSGRSELKLTLAFQFKQRFFPVMSQPVISFFRYIFQLFIQLF